MRLLIGPIRTIRIFVRAHRCFIIQVAIALLLIIVVLLFFYAVPVSLCFFFRAKVSQKAPELLFL